MSESTTVSLVPLLMSGRQFIEWASTASPFTWFDELWLFGVMPPRSVLRPASLAGSEGGVQVVDPDASAWMWAMGCVLGLGDGLGLAYVAADEMLRRLDLAVDDVSPDDPMR